MLTDSQDVAIINATLWIKHAYAAGQSAGIALERKRWRDKVCAMFGF